MQFDSLQDFIVMGGYGFFVWLSFGMTFLALAGLFIHSLWTRKQLVQRCVQMQQRQQRLARRRHEELQGS